MRSCVRSSQQSVTLVVNSVCDIRSRTDTLNSTIIHIILLCAVNFHSQKMSLPDFMTDANAVLNDKHHEWRYNIVPDYSKANALYDEGQYRTYRSKRVFK